MTPRSLLAPARLAGQPVLRTQSDERLVDLVRAGSEPAFEAIVARYRRALLRYCSRLLPEDRAEDAVQQTFVRAYDAMRGSEAELRLRPWLYRIAHNSALNALRDRGLRHEQLEDSFDGVERPDQALERNMGLRAVLGAVQDLPERQRDAILLRELGGRSYDEIATELGVTGGAVRQLLNRARNSVRAAATAVTPAGLLTRVPWAGPAEPVAARVAELCGAAGTGAVAVKICATALVAGAVVGGVATVPEGGREDAANARPKASQKDSGSKATTVPGEGAGSGSTGTVRRVEDGDISSGRGDRSGSSDGDGDSSGPGSGDGEVRSDSSGPGSGLSDGDSGSSGSGSDSSGSGSDSSGSGSGSSGSGSGSSGSGSGSSGSGSDSSGSGSGSSGSGSDSSGSGSDSSGSGSDLSGSGSDSSGSGSSGSG
jgi:RNA polymerase sigma factor (sigma-70 family)